MLFQFSQQMQKALSIYLDNPVIKEGADFYQNLVNQRMAESRQRNPTLRQPTISRIGSQSQS